MDARETIMKKKKRMKRKSNNKIKNKKGDGKNMERNYRFEYICSLTESGLKQMVIDELTEMGRDIIVSDGYVFSQGKQEILLCAHLDTVHKELVKEVVYDNGTISSPQGIGGDDRCGVYMIMEIIKTHDVSVAFFEQEETGGVGSMNFAFDMGKELKGKFKYVIELDRKGSHDAVYYDMYNESFQNFIEKEFWKESYGTFTDICNICKHLGCMGVNLSCGYYEQHTLKEYVVLSEMETVIEEVKKLLDRSEDVEVFEYDEYDYLYGDEYDDWYADSLYKKYNYYGDYSWYSSGNKKKKGVFEVRFIMNHEEKVYYAEAKSFYEAIGNFCVKFPSLCYDDVLSCTKK